MDGTHPAAADHLPPFITGPGQTDVLFIVVGIFLIGIVLLVGNFYLRLHALPEQVAHRTHKVQFEIVAILALLSLFTHNHLFWIAALLLAFIQLPDFSTPIASMARSLEKLARGGDRQREELKGVPEAVPVAPMPRKSRPRRRPPPSGELTIVPTAKSATDNAEARG